jgi:TonB family protein
MMPRRQIAQPFAPALACVLLVNAAVCLQSQGKGDGSPAEEVYELGPGVIPPRVIKQVPPRHSAGSGVRVVGSITVELVVSSQGIPRDVRVLKGLDKDLDQNTIEAVEQWRFTPAQKDRRPVAVRLSLEIAFHEM